MNDPLINTALARLWPITHYCWTSSALYLSAVILTKKRRDSDNSWNPGLNLELRYTFQLNDDGLWMENHLPGLWCYWPRLSFSEWAPLAGTVISASPLSIVSGDCQPHRPYRHWRIDFLSPWNSHLQRNYLKESTSRFDGMRTKRQQIKN